MKALAAGILASFAWSAALLGQAPDRSLERIGVALQQPSAIVGGVRPIESDLPKKLGVFTLVSPRLRGEMVRVSVPVGEYVTRAFKGVAAANQRRTESAARRRVASALKQFVEQPQPPKH